MSGSGPAEIWVDGHRHEVDASKNLLDVCLGLGYDLPYFCWHPALGSVGACRQCAVKQFRSEEDQAEGKGALVMACMTPASPGTRIAIEDPEARELRTSVIEWLMVNHPHDCPVCDEGGECHLQDMTVKTGHNYRNYRFQKKTYRDQDLGPLINHEMNRCIQCYRCVRFYGDYAGGHDLQVLGAHDHVYFGRHQDGVLESELSGNLVEVCPTGVFTDKSLKGHYTRKWDLQTAPSVCVHCSLGCNITPGERYGTLRRVRARYNGAVNGYFLCDRGRYGYEFVNHSRRLRTPLLPQGPDGTAQAISAEEARERLRTLLAGGSALGIGSPRASLESNFALRSLVGADSFYSGVGAKEAGLVDLVRDLLADGPARTPTLREVESCDAALILGEDVANSAPMLALALRQAARQQPLAEADAASIPRWHDAAVRELVQDRHGPLFVATPAPTRLDEVATETLRAAPEDLARFAFAVAHEIDTEAPAVSDLAGPLAELAHRVARALLTAQRPLVVSGTLCASEAVVRAAANVAWALARARRAQAAEASRGELLYVVPECNSLGLSLLGAPPLDAALERCERGEAEVVVVLENDLFRRLEPQQVERLLSAPHLVVLDHLAHDTAARAELVLPVGTFAEADGTLVNNEGRAQRFYQTFVAEGDVVEAWRWLSAAGGDAGVDHDRLVAAMAEEIPALRGVERVAPSASERWAGAKLPRALHRYSGRTAMLAHVELHEPKPPDDPDSPLAFSMEGFSGTQPASLVSEFWSPGWNSIQALNRFQEEIAGPLRGGDPGVRLIEPRSPRGEGKEGGERGERGGARPEYGGEIPAAFERRPDALRVVGLEHVFGSEELSQLAPGIAALAPEPYVALSPDSAADLGAEAGSAVEVSFGDRRHPLPVRIVEGLPAGTAGLPRGLQGPLCGPLPQWIAVTVPTEGER